MNAAGAGISALGTLKAVGPEGSGYAMLGIGYLLEIIGHVLVDNACACREEIYGRAASATPAGEAAPP